MKRKVYVGLDVHKETIRIAYLRVILKGNVEEQQISIMRAGLK
ncbi:hypothetical protein [Leptospira mayottensis]